MDQIIYMDHAATTPTDPRVVEAMTPFFTEQFGNSSSLYTISQDVARAIEKARQQCAQLIGANPEEIYFTSGGTESDNWALSGAMYAGEKKGRNELIISPIEHHAVLETAEFLQYRGFKLTVLPVDQYGLVDPEEVKKIVSDKTALVSVMHANNEIGTIQPITEIGEIVHQAGALLHTDAVQTVGKMPVDMSRLPVDLLSSSAHKFYGPKGVGFLYIRKGVRLTAFMLGGSQERRTANPSYTMPGRAGTHNTPGIVGMGQACRLAGQSMQADGKRLKAMTDRIKAFVMEHIPDCIYDGHPTRRLPGNAHFCFHGVEGEAILLCLDNNGICVSSGSACTTGALDPSHVLLAIGLPAEVAHGSLRITLGRSTTQKQVDKLLEVLPTVIARMRAMSPTYQPSGK